MNTTVYPFLAKCLTAGTAALQIACSSTVEKPQPPPLVVKPTGEPQHGIASIYTDNCTASGERYRSNALAAAHKSIPLGTKVRVTHLGNNRSVIVRINDRGPYIRGRIIDLTPAAAAELGFGYRQGIARVKVERL